ncbi:MAG TPA: beta-propeller fold lactonase family protein, partial [Longimicrobium sp.]|nr:beta-propeller fold lactonase family protein [Longimicrobium sp.]
RVAAPVGRGEVEMKKWGILAVAVFGLAACDGIFGSDDDDGDRGAVFTMNNAAAANHVILFARGDDGDLVRVDSFATGGQGSGPHPVFGTDPLESQDALILSDDDRFLFAVNAGSNEVTSFRVRGNGTLQLASRVSSGGQFPVSLAHRGTLLYVVNANGGGNVSGFRVGGDGTLTPIASSTRPLSGAAVPGPGSIRISPNGQTLVVTEKPTNLLVIYPLDANGVPGTRAVVPAPGPTPFGADFDPSGRYILSEGNVAPMRMAVPDGSTVSSATLSATAVTPITDSAPTTETAACWVQITPDGRFAYTTNTGSSSITGFGIGSNGALTRLTPDGKTGTTPAMSQPLDMAYADGYLFALTPGDGGIHVFRVETSGALTPVPTADVTATLPISVTGLAAM